MSQIAPPYDELTALRVENALLKERLAESTTKLAATEKLRKQWETAARVSAVVIVIIGAALVITRHH